LQLLVAAIILSFIASFIACFILLVIGALFSGPERVSIASATNVVLLILVHLVVIIIYHSCYQMFSIP